LQQWRLNGNGKVFLATGAGALCLKPTVGDECLEGEGVWLGEDCDDPHGFVLSNGTGTIPLLLGCRPGLCLAQNSSAGSHVHVAVCSDSNAKGWVATPD